MVRATEWRREQMYVLDSPGDAWVADGHIQLNEGETLGAVWISTNGLWASAVIDEASDVSPPTAWNLAWQPRVLRLGLLWTDNPITIVDPLSTLADPLWIHAAQWQYRAVQQSYDDSPATVPGRSRLSMYASHNTPNEKLEGQRAVGPGETRYLTFNGSESVVEDPFMTFHSHMQMSAVVSALVILPEGA